MSETLKYMFKGVMLAVGVILLSGLVNCTYPQNPVSYTFKVVETLPHDRNAYTQGLFFHNGVLYESCGQYGQSHFKKCELSTGKALRRLDFDPQYFAEGACVLNNMLYILTWQEHKCFVYDINTLKYLGQLPLFTEGWGLTTNGKELIMSDGSSTLYFLDPMTFVVKSKLNVKLKGKQMHYLNELEYINGEIWANVYGSDIILIIDPTNGVVKGVVDCKNLLPRSLVTSTTDVLNGIAYNPATKSLYLTGKNWPKMYKVEIVKKK